MNKYLYEIIKRKAKKMYKEDRDYYKKDFDLAMNEATLMCMLNDRYREAFFPDLLDEEIELLNNIKKDLTVPNPFDKK